MKPQFEDSVDTGTSQLKTLALDSRGGVTLEYTIILACVAVAACFALVALGVGMVHSFDFVRGLLLNPIP